MARRTGSPEVQIKRASQQTKSDDVLASDADGRKCFALVCTPVYPRTINRRFRCSSKYCGSMSAGVAGRSRSKCVRLAPVRRSGRLAINYWRPPACPREIDVVLVWRLVRWGRSVADLLPTLQEFEHLGVGFVSLTEALDLTTPAGRVMAGLLAIFAEFEREILRERRAGLAQARQNGKKLGRPMTAGLRG